MKTEFYKSVAINNTLKEIWVVSLDDGDITSVQKETYSDDTCCWIIDNYYFFGEDKYDLEYIVKSFDSIEINDIDWKLIETGQI